MLSLFLKLYLRKENITWSNVLEFSLLFIPLFLHWSAISFYNNRFLPNETDLYHKILFIMHMTLLLGMAINIEYAFTDDASVAGTTTKFLVFFLLSRLVYMGSYVFNAHFLPKFRNHFLIHVGIVCIRTAPWLVCMLLPNEKDGISGVGSLKVIMWAVGCIVEILGTFAYIVLSRIRLKFKYRLAINIEHLSERYGLLLIIVSGEIINSFAISSDYSQISPAMFGIFQGLLIAVFVEWAYTRAESSKNFRHAIRRHVVQGFLWNFSHLPLSMGIVGAGAAVGTLVKQLFQFSLY
ncbi:Low temperature requirement A [Paraphysoderma sedebokerense]|nr:Low temperature requirement A [Paraphysoderma sedebokerense]